MPDSLEPDSLEPDSPEPDFPESDLWELDSGLDLGRAAPLELRQRKPAQADSHDATQW